MCHTPPSIVYNHVTQFFLYSSLLPAQERVCWCWSCSCVCTILHWNTGDCNFKERSEHCQITPAKNSQPERCSCKCLTVICTVSMTLYLVTSLWTKFWYTSVACLSSYDSMDVTVCRDWLVMQSVCHCWNQRLLYALLPVRELDSLSSTSFLWRATSLPSILASHAWLHHHISSTGTNTACLYHRYHVCYDTCTCISIAIFLIIFLNLILLMHQSFLHHTHKIHVCLLVYM